MKKGKITGRLCLRSQGRGKKLKEKISRNFHQKRRTAVLNPGLGELALQKEGFSKIF
jgi:hypothetical protein